MQAAWNGHAEVAELLLDREARIDARDGQGVTALGLAASRGQTDLARLLLSRGADVPASGTTRGGLPSCWLRPKAGKVTARLLQEQE